MRASLALLAVAALTAGISAQATNPINERYDYDRSTEFTSRGSNGGNPGHVSQGYSYGATAGLATLTQTQYVMQDQNQVTREPWDVGTHELDAQGYPDFAAINTYATNLLLPANQTGIGAWLLTHTGLTSSPHKLNLKECGRWFHTWKLIQQTNWTTDGLSVHMSQGAPYNGTLQCFNTSRHREIERSEGKNPVQINSMLGWTGVANSKIPASNDRAWRLRTNWKESVLNGLTENKVYNCLAAIRNPCPGYCSVYPDFNNIGQGNPSRDDDFQWRVRADAGTFGGGLSILFFSTANLKAVPTPFGPLHIDITDPLFALGPQAMKPGTTAGEWVLDLGLGASKSTLRKAASDLVNWAAQALLVSSNLQTLELTSGFAMNPNTGPTGYTKGTTNKATAPAQAGFSVAHKPSQPFMHLRNFGPGEVTVQGFRGDPTKAGATKIGVATIVPEGEAMRVTLSAAANFVGVITKYNTNATTNPINFTYGYNK